jgi:polysaccharide biosynthesis transport protein
MFFRRRSSAAEQAAYVKAPAAQAQSPHTHQPQPVRSPSLAPDMRPPVEPEGELDVRALGRSLWRRKLAIIIPTIIVTVLAAVAVHVITPKFKSSATVLYEGRENIFLRPDADRSTADRGPADEFALTSQVQLMLSRELALEVIKKLKLNEKPEFDPVLKGIPPWKYALIMTGLLRNPLKQTPEERVLESYFERLTAFPIDRSRVITIEFTSQDPKLAALAANTVADLYLELQQQARQQQTTAASEWLQDRINKLRPRVEAAEAKVAAYRSHTNLVVGTNNTTLSSQQLGEFNSQLALARAQKADAETRARIIHGMLQGGGAIEASDVLNSDLIRRLSEQRVTLRAQLAEQSATLLDNHPRIRELKAQIADLDGQIRAEAEKVARSFENDAKIADGRVTALSQSLDELKRQAATTNEQDVQLRALERDARSLRDLLESYLAKYREATARETIGDAPPDTRIISRAVVSNTPYFPKKLPSILVAMLATMVISAGFVTTGELMRQPAAPPAPLAPATTAVADDLGVPPSRVSRAVTHPELGVPLRAIDDLAASLRAAGEGGQRVTVFGAARNVGTTLSAVTLARALSRGGRVILIDLAVGAPNLAAIAADPQAPGVAEIARGMASFGDVITRDKLSRVHLVNAGRTGAAGSAIVASPRLATFIEALALTYDHVLVDAGTVADAPLEWLARLTRRAVLVTTEETAPATRAARDRLAAAGYGEITILDGAASAAAAAA